MTTNSNKKNDSDRETAAESTEAEIDLSLGEREMQRWQALAEESWRLPATPEEALVRIAMEVGEYDDSWNRICADGIIRARVPDGQDRSVLQTDLLDRLTTGKLLATGCRAPATVESERVPLNPEVWHFLAIDFKTNSAIWREAAENPGEAALAAVMGLKGWKSQYEMLLIYRPTQVERARAVVESKASATRKCRDWMKAQGESGEQWTKESAWAAVQVLCAGLSHRQFLRAWDEEAPPEWKRPGRKSKQSNRNTVSKRK